MNYNPIRRTLLCKVKRGKKERGGWHPQIIRLDATGMAKLRSEAFQRSGGWCECGMEGCQDRVTWTDSQLHHRIHRSKGGSDVLENVIFVSRRHHEIIHGTPQWSKKR